MDPNKNDISQLLRLYDLLLSKNNTKSIFPIQVLNLISIHYKVCKEIQPNGHLQVEQKESLSHLLHFLSQEHVLSYFSTVDMFLIFPLTSRLSKLLKK